MRTVSTIVCLHNYGYEASLIVGKIYRAVNDHEAAAEQLLRVVDESGEDYLYQAAFFAPIELPEEIAKALNLAA